MQEGDAVAVAVAVVVVVVVVGKSEVEAEEAAPRFNSEEGGTTRRPLLRERSRPPPLPFEFEAEASRLLHTGDGSRLRDILLVRLTLLEDMELLPLEVLLLRGANWPVSAAPGRPRLPVPVNVGMRLVDTFGLVIIAVVCK